MLNYLKLISSSIILIMMSFYTIAQDMTVMSYNIRYDDKSELGWDARKDILISLVAYHRPHILGTQEGLIHQLYDISNGLKGYERVGVGRDYGDDRGEHTVIYYDTQLMDIITHGTFWLSETPDIPSRGWDAALNRTCTYAILEYRQTGKQVLVFNTHFDHMGKEARLKSAGLILSKINDINKANLPVVLMGDFNLEPTSEGIVLLQSELQDAHLESDAVHHGPEGTFNAFDTKSPSNRRIDYVFYKNTHLKVSREAVFTDSFYGLFPSDHFPVYVEFYFK